MAVQASPEVTPVDYRYFVCDLQTNNLLAELPFRSVTFSRSLGEAGTFTGDLPVVEATYNYSIYENTLPGKTALYVVRNGVCVWGGIIWGRTYSLIDKIVSITAAEFQSYFSHRVVWKTWSSDYEAEAVVSGGTATITLSNGQYGFEVGEAIYLNWGTDLAIYNGTFGVLTETTNVDGNSVITVTAQYYDASGGQKTIPDMGGGEPLVITVQTRQDTYEFARDLLNELKTDLFDFDFANDEIRPGIDLFNEITSVARTSNVATIVTTKKHELSPGQKIKVSDVQSDTSFNASEAAVLDIIDDKTFTYASIGSDVSTTTESDSQKTVTAISRDSNIATFTTSTSHGFSVGDIVFVENVSETFDGYHTVYGVTTPSQFTAVIIGINIVDSDTDTVQGNPRVTRRASVSYGSFGEHTTLGDIGFDLIAQYQADSNYEFSNVDEPNPTIRGFELKTVAEILDDYSAKPYGFEYRIDCEYDSATSSFKKIFKFLPLVPAGVTSYISAQGSGFTGAIPVSAYDRASELIFEFPGNVLEAQFEENAEEAATRFFVRGEDTQLGTAASQPYSAATNHQLLREGWPILDAVETLDSDSESVLWKHAQRLLSESIPPISTFTISVNGSARPSLGDYDPGDWCTVKLNDDFVDLRALSYLEQDYGSDNGVLVRKIYSYEIAVPDSPGYPEGVNLELITEPSIPISGVTVVNGNPLLET